VPRIAIGEISHETNTFSPPTTLAMFRDRLWVRGDELLERFRGVRSYLGGMIEEAERRRVTLLPTFAASTEPWGTITREAYDAMLGELLDGLRRAMPLDAVCLALHGAGVAEGVPDLESAVLEAVRGVVGEDLPIAVTLDLHGNLHPRMADLATGLFSVHEYPHTDAHERGQEAMAFLLRVLGGGLRPVAWIETLPLLVPPSPSVLDPARTINEICLRWEAAPGMIDCAFVHGFVATDVGDVGASVVATADADRDLARRAAQAVAAEIWERRQAFQVTHPQPAEAVGRAVTLASDGGPVVINETSDNPGGGTPGDGTHLLRAMVLAGLTDSVYGTLYDPEVAARCHEAGVGARLRVRLGGKHDRLHGDPLDLEVYVKSLADGRFRLSTPMARGTPVDLGKTARLACEGLEIIVASARTQVLDPEPFALHGIDVRRCRIVGLKSSAHFRAGFEGIARHIVTTDPPGISTSNVAQYPYRRLRRPIYPLDRDATYTPRPPGRPA